jgi:hypothetical protein
MPLGLCGGRISSAVESRYWRIEAIVELAHVEARGYDLHKIVLPGNVRK